MKVVTSCALLLLVSGLAAAQEPAMGTSHEQAAVELVAVLRLEEQSALSLDVMTKNMVAQNPMFGPIEEVITEFYRDFMGWDVMGPAFIQIYTDAYSEPELRQLIEFYRTPIGQKVIEQTPFIMEQTTAKTQELLQPHMGELQRRIMARLGGTDRDG